MTDELTPAAMKALIAKKAKERAPKVPRTQVVGWTDDELDALGDRFTAIEPTLLALQTQELIRIRSAGAGTVGILDDAGQWIPRDAPTREWPTAIAALETAGFTVTEEGELVASAAPAAEPKPTRRGRAAAEG